MKKIKFPQIKRQPINYSTINVVPFKYYPFLYDLNNVYSLVDSSIILGRDKEINRICNCFFRNKKANAILLGDHGVGKTAIVQKLVDNVIKKKCPKEMYNYHFLYLDIGLILANLSFDKKMPKKLGQIFEFLYSYTNIVVVIDQVHLVQASELLSYYFAVLVKHPNIKILGLSTEEEFYQFFEFDKKTRSRLEIIPIFEPKPNKIYPMIKNVIHRLEIAHGVTISKALVRYIICVSQAFTNEICNPELTVDIVEKSMIVAKRKHKEEVSKKDVNSNFNFNYELYKKMSKEDKEITAYHEAGHFVVSKMSENIRNYKTTAITIVPAEYFLGLTTFEFELEKQTSCDKNYYIDNIAVDLAGREAEIIYYGSEDKLTSGAREDLISSTKTARRMITEYGMTAETGKNISYLGIQDFTNLSLISEKIKDAIDEATKKLISEAEKRAKNILKENDELLRRIAQELMENEVLDECDLNRICKEVVESKKIVKSED